MFGFTAPAHARFDATPTPVYREYIAAGGLAAGKFVRADTNGVAAGAVGFLSREEAGFGLGVAPAMGAFNYEFGYGFISDSSTSFFVSMGRTTSNPLAANNRHFFSHILVTPLK